MIIVAGHLQVGSDDRTSYLEGCEEVVRQARVADGCLDFALSPDLVDPTRINVFERWASLADLEAFRGSGPDGDQTVQIPRADVMQFEVTSTVIL